MSPPGVSHGRDWLDGRYVLNGFRDAARVEDGTVLGRGNLPASQSEAAQAADLGSQPQVLVLGRIAEHVHWVLALLDTPDVVLQHLAEHDDADVRPAEG